MSQQVTLGSCCSHITLCSSPWGDVRDFGLSTLLLVGSMTPHGVLIQPKWLSPGTNVGSWTTVGHCGFPGCPGGHIDYTFKEHARLFNPASVNQPR